MINQRDAFSTYWKQKPSSIASGSWMMIQFEERNWTQYSFHLEYRQPLYLSLKGTLSQVNYDTLMTGFSLQWKWRKTNLNIQVIFLELNSIDYFLCFTPLTHSSDHRKNMRKVGRIPSSINHLLQTNPQHTEFYSKLQQIFKEYSNFSLYFLLTKTVLSIKGPVLEIKKYIFKQTVIRCHERFLLLT